MAVSRFNVRTGNRTELIDITDKVIAELMKETGKKYSGNE